MSFVLPEVKESSIGFGPPEEPQFFKDVPYATFSKTERVGRPADWISSKSQQFQPSRYQTSTNNASGDRGAPVASPFALVDEEDDDEFELVDSRPTQQQRSRQFNTNRWGRGARRGGPTNARGRPGQRNTVTQPRQRQTYGRGGGGGQRRWNDRNRNIEASIHIDHSWGDPIDTFEFNRLQKLKGVKFEEGDEVYDCGTVHYLNTAITASSKPSNLERHHASEKVFPKETASNDPIMRGFADQGEADIFVTDTVLSHLLTVTKSVYSWDIIVTKSNGKIWLDKRNNKIDQLTVNENSSDPPDAAEGAEAINSPAVLAQEATTVNKNFSQQVLLADKTFSFESPNPFQHGSNVPSVAYKYKTFALGDHNVVCRFEIDAVKPGKTGETVLVSVKSLNEYDPRATGDWRKKLGSQKTAILATELKNNGAKIARWVVAAIMAGAGSIELGFVARQRPNDNQNHTILAVQSFKPSELAESQGINFDNLWSIFKTIIDVIDQQEDGKYLLFKDSQGPNLKLFKLPHNALADEPTSSSGTGQLILK